MAGVHGGVNADNFVRDGAGCFGKNNGVPPSEVSKIELYIFISKIILQALTWAGIPSPGLSNKEVACPKIS